MRRKRQRRRRKQESSWMAKTIKRLFWIAVIGGFSYWLTSFIFKYYTTVEAPVVENTTSDELIREVIGKDFYSIGNNWLRKNDRGIWEMYLEGNAYERGVVHGKLAKELTATQEKAFLNHINQTIPSSIYRQFLKLAVTWFNCDINQHITDEYQEEIAGVSRYMSEEHAYICLLYTSPSPRDLSTSRMPSSA